MPLLYYRRPDNYRRDLDSGAGFHLNQASARLHDVNLGDSFWAFTRARDGRYALAAGFAVMRSITQAGPDHGELYRMPDRRVTARVGDAAVLGSHIRAIRQGPYRMSQAPMPIEGEYSLTNCRVGADHLGAECIADVSRRSPRD